MLLTNRGSAGDCELAGLERNQLMMPSLSAYGVQGRNLAIHFSVNDTRIGKNWGSRSKHIYIKFTSPITFHQPCNPLCAVLLLQLLKPCFRLARSKLATLLTHTKSLIHSALF